MDRHNENDDMHMKDTQNTEAQEEACAGAEAGDAGDAVQTLPEKARAMGMEELARQTGVGVPTLTDVAAELMKPGRDPRDELPPPLLRTDVLSMEDLKPGMELMGTVRNVIDFGAFIDIGVHQDGLVHISQISDRYIKHPSEVLKVGDIVKVWVLSVDTKKKRISLTMRARSAPRAYGESHVSEAES